VSARGAQADAPIIVWLRSSLRLADHPALHAADASGRPLLCLYVLDDTADGRPLGAASRWWLAQSLKALDKELQQRGGALVLRKADAARAIVDVAREAGAHAVYANRIFHGPQQRLAARVAEALAEIDVGFETFHADLLIEPAATPGADDRGPRVFTPFWKRVQARGSPPVPLPAPKRLRAGPRVQSDTLAHWRLEPSSPDWAGGLRQTWQPGEAAARQRLHDFLESGLAGYAMLRDRPDRDNTSRLSPHLRFGEINPRQIWHAAMFKAEQEAARAPDVSKFLSELGWREFSHHLLAHNPDLAQRNLQGKFDSFPWRQDAKAREAWQTGRTGYPIVDAGMRELWRTGTMHNRVRMVVASFLVKHLLIDWRAGEAWFWDTLVDADPANNPASWQWVAGSGADAAPYFRIFNPVLQGEKFDPDAAYVHRFVPELKALPAPLVHRPWTAAPIELAGAELRLGDNYAAPIVDHAVARRRALDAFAKISGKT